MKVSVYKLDGGGLAVLVQASPGKGKTPVLLQEITPENIKSRVGPLLVEMGRPRLRPQESRL